MAASVSAAKGVRSAKPALLTSTSSPPNRAAASAISASAVAGSVRSASAISARAPAARTLPATASTPSRLRRVCSRTATPGAASWRQTAAPIPLAAPVTRTERGRSMMPRTLREAAASDHRDRQRPGCLTLPGAADSVRRPNQGRTGIMATHNGSGDKRLRSRRWFDNPADPAMTALYLERYMNYGITPDELRSGKPIIGIAQTGSDLSPCNRHHVELASRVRDGIRAAGGVPLEFPIHPIQETGKRPTAALDRNLAYLSLVEVLHGYPIDGVVLTTGCDKTTPACLMGAATVNIPAIVLSGGPMLDGWWQGRLSGSGTIVWEGRKLFAEGKIGYDEFMDMVSSSAPSVGHCNTMGTATSMNSLAEALGMSLPGCAAIP